MFRKFFLVGVLALVLPVSAQGAITLDAGTGVTVVCERDRPFRGHPFARATPSSDPVERRVRVNKRSLFFGLYHWETPEHKEVDGDAMVRVRRTAPDTYRIRVTVGNVTWDGC